MNLTMKSRGLLQALLLAAAACVGLATAEPAQAYEDGWRTCADEGQTCRVSGRAVVRFGTDGRWVSRSVYNNVACNNDTFGDPAPEVPKRCQVRTSGNDGSGNYPGTALGWSFCAAEGEFCRFKGAAEVRFGQGNKFVTRSAYGGVRCDVADFGDPAYGVTKFCEIHRSGHHNDGNEGSWGGSGSSGSDWRYCAAENGRCSVRTSAQVRFGDGRNWKTRTVKGDVSCDIRTFGDPAYGVVKHCEVQSSKDGNDNASSWRRCASEDQTCEFGGFAQVRYGTAGRYIYRDGTNGVRCNSNYFGGDPYPGKVKACEVKR